MTAEQAVDDFRSNATQEREAETPTAEPQSAPAPARPGTAPAAQPQQPRAAQGGYAPIKEGVFVFATEGYEETDALTGQRHDYPDETAMTIRNGGCGWISRWEPMRERWEETELCEKADGTSMGRYTIYHEFFQRGDREDFSCPDSYVQKPSAKPGDTWTFSCTSKQSKVDGKVTVVGLEDVNVGGRLLPTARYRYDIKVSGANTGTIVQDRWLSSSPRVMARMTQDADMTVSSPFGPVSYEEKFQIDLTSVEPRT
ncbi:MAG: hypothetical protein ACRDKJ_05440 [Actinomycetota bacterium]